MSTIKDIAKNCGVSIATVSNVLNGKGSPSEATKIKVIETASKMNYVPNFMARNLKQRETKLIGVIAEDLTVFNMPEIIDGINEYTESKGYALLLGNLRILKKYGRKFYQEDKDAFYADVMRELRIMESKNVDGIIYIGAHRRVILPLNYRNDLPIVIAYGDSDDKDIPVINYDDVKGAYDITNVLLESKHDVYGAITGDEKSVHSIARLEGFKKALEDNGLIVDDKNLISGQWDRDVAKKVVVKLLSNGVTGIFAMNDRMALGVYDYARENNLQIGKDIDVVGFDNLDFANVLTPNLNTVNLPLHEIGNKSAEVLISIIENKFVGKVKSFNISCDVVKRD